MSCKVFIDGSSGTTGLRIAERLAGRPELELLSIDEPGRKDLARRAEVINSADLAFLCLPDAASREVVPLIDSRVKVLDTSTAPRRGGSTASPSCTASGKSCAPPTGWRCRAATPRASSRWPGPWSSWALCRRIIPSPATA